MRFTVEAGFEHARVEPRYFVRSLGACDDGYAHGYRWEVQFLNPDGQGGATLQFGPADGPDLFSLLNLELPTPVIAAARSGLTDYVDSEGSPRRPF
jgi:hypothetical protein